MAQVKALSLGGLGSPCCCGGGCNVTICAFDCSTPINGATVSISGGASCTTNASGCCSLNIGTSGTYTVTVSKTGIGTVTKTMALTCGGEYNIPILGITFCLQSWCGQVYTCGDATITVQLGGTTVFTGNIDSSGCITAPLATNTYTVTITSVFPGTTVVGPQTFTCGTTNTIGLAVTIISGTLTDANGSYPLCTNSAIGGLWVCTPSTPASPICPSTGSSISVVYLIVCSATVPGSWDVNRYWPHDDIQGCYIGNQIGSGFSCADGTTCAPCQCPVFCLTNDTGASIGQGASDPCDPTGAFTASLSLNPDCSSSTSADPVGGTVAVSFTV